MSRLIITGILLLQALFSFAQNAVKDSVQTQTSGKRRVDRLTHNLSFGLPILNLDFCIPFRDRRLLGLPAGMGNYFYYTKPSIGSFLTAQEGSFRLLSLYYKDKIGMELYYGSYGTSINTKKFDDYLNKNFPGYYTGTALYGLSDWYQYFGGFIYGIACRIHRHRFVIEPKLLLGYSSPGTYDVTDSYGFKEKGSNQYLLFTVDKLVLASPAINYHLVLNFGRKFTVSGTHFAGEWGIKAEYVRIPYRNKVTITEQTFSSGPSVQQFEARDVYQMVNAGVFAAFTFGKKNAKKPKLQHH